MGSFVQITVFFVLLTTVLSEPPVYSANYAQIRYQPRENWGIHKAELNLDERHKEEVTEKLLLSTTNSNSHSFDITTEPQSEQINLERFIHRNIVKDKLIEEPTTVKIFDDGEYTTHAIKKEPTINVKDEYETVTDSNKNNRKENILAEESETLDDLDESEVSDLNEQGIYYIYHPDMLLQKVVYKIHGDSRNKEYSTEVKYENVAPIIEPVYSYDPRTFVFQRLILRPQDRT